jgi:hypothetical protein
MYLDDKDNFTFTPPLRHHWSAGTMLSMATESHNMTSSSVAAAAALQTLAGFGCLHNSAPAYSALYSSSPSDPITIQSTTMLSNHLVCGHCFLLLENNLSFSILLGIHSSDILSTCPSHLSLCAYTNCTMSCPLISSFTSAL